MREITADAAILIADITGSTRLYESLGNLAARRVIGEELARLRAIVAGEGGEPVAEKGDDILARFDDPAGALRAVRAMLARHSSDSLRIHAGLHFGQVIAEKGDVFGETVNIAARLAAMANPGEVCLGEAFVACLAEPATRSLRPLGTIPLKGVGAPVEVWSLVEEEAAARTEVVSFAGRRGAAPGPQDGVVLVLLHGQTTRRCRHGQSLTLGRAADSDLAFRQPWISRNHLVARVEERQVVIQDMSAAGTFVIPDAGPEFLLHRRSAALTGSGAISLALASNHPDADPVRYEIVER